MSTDSNPWAKPPRTYLIVIGDNPDEYLEYLRGLNKSDLLEMRDFVSFARGIKPEKTINSVEDGLRELAPLMLSLFQVFPTKEKMEAAWKNECSDLVTDLVDDSPSEDDEDEDARMIPMLMAGREFFVPMIRKDLVHHASNRNTLDRFGDSKLVKVAAPLLMKSGVVEHESETYLLAIHPATINITHYWKYKNSSQPLAESAFVNPTNCYVIRTSESLSPNPKVTVYAEVRPDLDATVVAFPNVRITEVGES